MAFFALCFLCTITIIHHGGEYVVLKYVCNNIKLLAKTRNDRN